MRFVVLSFVVMMGSALSAAIAAVDPTKPALVKGMSASESNLVDGDLALQSIFKRSSGYSAIISGKSYREGDTVYEFTVSKINPKHVIITDGRQQKILRMYDAYEIEK